MQAMLRWSGLIWLLAMIPLAVVQSSMAEPKVIDLVIHGRSLAPEQRVIRVQQGDAVTLRWTSDQTLTLHLHGYDVERRVAPGAAATMSFTAHATGRFPIEVHASEGRRETTLGYLEVHPR
jgi:FtsP/CotA-like multicopper oxidase with cupredoxin domain